MKNTRLRLAVIVAAAGSLTSAPALAAPDATLLWLAAGEHDAPCDAGLRCASRLDCDPARLRCRLPPKLGISVDDVQGCDPSFEVWLSASNDGEIALDEEVLLTTSVTGTFVVPSCSQWNGWDPAHCDWSGPFMDSPINSSIDSVRIELPPGAHDELVVHVDLSLYDFTTEANLSVEVDGSSWTPAHVERWSAGESYPIGGTNVCF
jgi:hypothetical protein